MAVVFSVIPHERYVDWNHFLQETPSWRSVIPHERYVDWNTRFAFAVKVTRGHTAWAVCGLKSRMPLIKISRIRHTAWAVCGLKWRPDWLLFGVRKSYRMSGMWIEIVYTGVDKQRSVVIPRERYVDWNSFVSHFVYCVNVIPHERYMGWNTILVLRLLAILWRHTAREVYGLISTALNWSLPELSHAVQAVRWLKSKTCRSATTPAHT